MTGCKKPQTVENLGRQEQADPVLIGLEFVPSPVANGQNSTTQPTKELARKSEADPQHFLSSMHPQRKAPIEGLPWD